MNRDADSPFSFMVKVAHISLNPVTVRISADKDELDRLARQWGVREVLSFDAEAALGRWKRDGIRVKGKVTVSLIQDCVVTLEPVGQEIDEDFEAIFVPEGSRLANRALDGHGEMFIDPDGPDAPEVFTGDSIDVGAVAAEFAALSIDPYPRTPGAGFADLIEDDPVSDKKPSPFAVLQGFKRDDSAG